MRSDEQSRYSEASFVILPEPTVRNVPLLNVALASKSSVPPTLQVLIGDYRN